VVLAEAAMQDMENEDGGSIWSWANKRLCMPAVWGEVLVMVVAVGGQRAGSALGLGADMASMSREGVVVLVFPMLTHLQV